MAQIDISEIDELVGLRDRPVVDRAGEAIGKIEQIWVDDVNGQPEWATVKSGRVRGHSRYVPLRAAELGADGVAVNYTKDQVEQAPAFDPQTATRRDIVELYRHYDQPLPAPPPPEVRNPFASSQPVWAPTRWSGGDGSTS